MVSPPFLGRWLGQMRDLACPSGLQLPVGQRGGEPHAADECKRPWRKQRRSHHEVVQRLREPAGALATPCRWV